MRVPAHIEQLARIWRDIADAADPRRGAAYDGAPQRHRREPPIPGEATARFRTLQRWLDAQILQLTNTAHRRFGDPVDEGAKACRACGRPFGGRTRSWSAVDAAVLELELTLAGGPLPAADVTRAVMDAVRCSERTVRDAARRLGVQRSAGTWRLPNG